MRWRFLGRPQWSKKGTKGAAVGPGGGPLACLGRPKIVPAERQDLDLLAGRGIDRVCDRGTDRRDARLTDARRRFSRGYDVHLDPWHLLDRQHPVSVEVGLLDPTPVKRDLALQNRAQAEADASFHLSLDDVRVD